MIASVATLCHIHKDLASRHSLRVLCYSDPLSTFILMPIEFSEDKEKPQVSLTFTVSNNIVHTPRMNPTECEDRAEVFEDENCIDILIADGATGVGGKTMNGKAPGWYAVEKVAQEFGSDARKKGPQEFVTEVNRALRTELTSLVGRGELNMQEMTDLCSAVCVVVRIGKKDGALRFAATKADCWLLVHRADDSMHWLTSDPEADMDYGIIKTSYDLMKAGEISEMKGSLVHPDVAAAVLRGRSDANHPSGKGNGRINGAPDACLALYVEDNEANPFVLQLGDNVISGTDGFFPLMPRAIFEEKDPVSAAKAGREYQRRYVEAAIRAGGPQKLLEELIHRETVEDPNGIRYPHIKDKTGDDKALVQVVVSASSGNYKRQVIKTIGDGERHHLLSIL